MRNIVFTRPTISGVYWAHIVKHFNIAYSFAVSTSLESWTISDVAAGSDSQFSWRGPHLGIALCKNQFSQPKLAICLPD